MTKGMRNLRETTAVKDFRTGTEGSKVEGCIFKQLTRCAVRREIHLKASVKAESINNIGTNAAANGVRRFKDGPVNAALLQRVRARKTCQSGSDDRCARHSGIVVRGCVRGVNDCGVVHVANQRLRTAFWQCARCGSCQADKSAAAFVACSGVGGGRCGAQVKSAPKT